MSAGMEENDRMFSVGTMPWHKHQGTTVLDDYPQDIDLALITSGLDWTVKVVPLGYVSEGPSKIRFMRGQQSFHIDVAPGGSSIMGVIREDTGELLASVSPDYQAFQNRQQFDFLQGIIGDKILLETAGSLYGGRQVYVLAVLPESLSIGGDECKTYLFITGGHDGKHTVRAAATTVRIVCANTLRFALDDCQSLISFTHTGDMEAKAKQMADLLEMSLTYAKRTKEIGDQLATVAMPWATTAASDYWQKVYDPILLNETGMRAWQKKMNDLLVIYQSDTAGNSPKTLWSAYNTVIEYQDWHRRVLPSTDQMVRSFKDNTVKIRALDVAMEMAKP